MTKIYNLLKYYSIIAFIMNAVAVAFQQIPNLIGISFIGTLSTILFLIAAGIDLGLIYLTLNNINREDEIGQKLKKICWLSILLFLLAICMLMVDSLVYSFIEVGSILRTFAAIGGILAYFIIYISGCLMAYLILKNIDRSETWR